MAIISTVAVGIAAFIFTVINIKIYREMRKLKAMRLNEARMQARENERHSQDAELLPNSCVVPIASEHTESDPFSVPVPYFTSIPRPRLKSEIIQWSTADNIREFSVGMICEIPVIIFRHRKDADLFRARWAA